eukprot:SAG22_NODE_173_length_16589_cov_120.738933_3_plen_129_part_00
MPVSPRQRAREPALSCAVPPASQWVCCCCLHTHTHTHTQILAACKAKAIPVAVILINGGAVAIDPVVPAAPAIVEAFYPSVRGGEALTMMAFGETPLLFGKLPITMYDKVSNCCAAGSCSPSVPIAIY